MTTSQSALTLTDLLVLHEQIFIDAVRGRGRAALARLRERTTARVDEALALVRGGEEVPDELAAAILVGLADVVARDVAAVVDHTDLGHARRLWADLGERAPRGYAAPPWCLSALAAWQEGDRRAGLVDVQHCLDDDPAYTLGLYVQTACRHDVPMGPLLGTEEETVAQRRSRLADGVPRARAHRT